jgi:hypothetical protein
VADLADPSTSLSLSLSASLAGAADGAGWNRPAEERRTDG